MKLDSQDLLNLLADARERHGAPCRVEVYDVTEMEITVAAFWLRDLPYEEWAPRETIWLGF